MYTQVTLLDFRTDLDAAVESSAYWSSTEKNSAINEAIRQWNLMTGQWRRTDVISSVQDQHWYTVPSGTLIPFRVTWESLPLYFGSVVDLDNSKPGWEGQTAGDSGVPSRPMLWAPKGINRVCLWPAPASTGVQFTIDSVASLVTLSSDTDYIDVGREEHGAILSYALHYLAFKEGGPRFQASISYYQNFLRLAGEKNARLQAATFYKEALAGKDLERSQEPSTSRPQPVEQPRTQ